MEVDVAVAPGAGRSVEGGTPASPESADGRGAPPSGIAEHGLDIRRSCEPEIKGLSFLRVRIHVQGQSYGSWWEGWVIRYF